MLTLLFVAFLGLTLLCGLPVVLDYRNVPTIVKELLAYGKVGQGAIKLPLVKSILVPKRWFVHFYALGSFCATLTTVFALWDCYKSNKSSENVEFFAKIGYWNDFLEPVDHIAASTSTLLATILFTLHMYRRLYECVAISVYSSNSSINLLQYLTGLLHYLGVSAALIVAKPGCFRRETEEDCFRWQNLHLRHLVGVALYTLGCYYQHQCNIILANLRKDAEGKVVSQKHSAPRGGLFEWVTCPHYFCEIVIYIGFYFILGHKFWLWGVITVWVIANQIVAALTSHRWYTARFPSYATNRKAIIPRIL